MIKINPLSPRWVSCELSGEGNFEVGNSTIFNAEIIVNSGGNLIVQNEGVLQQGENDNIDVKLGGLMQFETGEIRKFE